MKSSVLQNTLNKGRYEERERKKGRVSRLNASMTFCLFLCCIDSRWKTRPYIINSRKSAVILQQAMHIIWRKLYFSAASRDSTGSCGHIVLDRTAGSEKPIDEVYVRERPFGLKKLYSSRLIPPRLHFIRCPLRSSAARSNTAGVAADKFFSDTEADVDSVWLW